MKLGSAVALAIAAVPAVGAAQDERQAPPEVRQQATAMVQKYDAALSGGDWSALSSLYVPGALVLTPFGKLEDGSRDSHIADKLHTVGFHETSRVEDVEPVFGGQGLLVTAAYTATFSPERKIPASQGYDFFVLERVGGDWKIRANSVSRLVHASQGK